MQAGNQRRRLFARYLGAAAGLVLLASAEIGLAQQSQEAATLGEVQAEFAEAFAAIGRYTAQEREEALAALDKTLERLDGRIEQLEQRLRDRWSEMSTTARRNASDSLRRLRSRRNDLSKAYGALARGSESAWDELVGGVRDGWNELEAAWDEAASAAPPQTERRE